MTKWRGIRAHRFAFAQRQLDDRVLEEARDVHLKRDGGAPKSPQEITADAAKHAGDNSAEDNNHTPLGNACFPTTVSLDVWPVFDGLWGLG